MLQLASNDIAVEFVRTLRAPAAGLSTLLEHTLLRSCHFFFLIQLEIIYKQVALGKPYFAYNRPCGACGAWETHSLNRLESRSYESTRHAEI